MNENQNVGNGGNGKKLSLAERAAQALQQQQKGVTVAATAAKAEGVTDQGLQALKVRATADKELGQELLAIAAAREGVVKNPDAWRAFLSERLAFAAGEDHPDPRKVVALLRGAMSRKMPGEEGAPAYPLFVVPAKGTENKWSRRLYISRVVREDGKLQGRGVMCLVPAAGNEQDLANARIARTKAATEFLEELESVVVGNIRNRVQQACWLFEASVCDRWEFKKFFEPKSDGLFAKKNRSGLFRHFKLSDDEHFVIKESGQAQRLVTALEVLETRVHEYLTDEFDVEEMIGGTLLKYPDRHTSPDAFLRGMPGITAACNPAWEITTGKNGKEQKKKVAVTALFERRDDGAWRAVICTRNGAESLFGTNFRFHEWQTGEIPPHVKVFLAKAEKVEVTVQESAPQ